jgi:hypothetical protein
VSINWIPDPQACQQDEDDLKQHVRERIAHCEADHMACGFPHGIWLSDKTYVQGLKNGMTDWIDSRDGVRSWETVTLDVLVSFRDPTDLLLFKLTWGGG